jgi:translation initiation factor IF-2
VTQAVVTATKPVTQPVVASTAPVTTAVAAATKPVTQAAAPVTQAVAQAAKPVTQTVTQAAKPVTQAVATTAKPVAQAVATATAPVTRTAARATAPVAKPLTQAVASATAPVQAAASTPAAPVAARTAKKRLPLTGVAKPAEPARTQDSAARGTAPAASSARTLRAVVAAPKRGASAAAAAQRGSRIHVALASRTTRSRAVGGGRARLAVVPAQPLAPSLRPAIERPAPTFAGQLVAAPSAPVLAVAAPSGGNDGSNSALGLAALVGAGGAALLRLRQSAAATGLADPGTLSALAHSASVFWAGSCYPLGTPSTSVSLTSSLHVEPIARARALGGRASFGVAGAVSGAAEAVGGRVSPASASFVRAPGDDRTVLVMVLLTASAAMGAVLGAVVPGRRGIRS